MGANAIICDPHRALITGPTQLYGTEITSFDLRAGATMVIAALIARDESIIDGIQQIDRGYENIEERLQKIGADITRIKNNSKSFSIQRLSFLKRTAFTNLTN